MTDGTALEQFRRLLNVRQHHGAGQRAPHKPLLLLMALARLDQTGSSALAWADAHERFDGLLSEFGGPPRAQGKNLRFPFTRLPNDGIWELSREVAIESIGDLEASPIEGHFTPALEAHLGANPELLRSAARHIALGQFPDTIAGDVLSAVGFDPGEVLGSSGLPRQVDLIARQRRDPEWRRNVLHSWDHRCGFCGFSAAFAGRSLAVEAAHIRWFSFSGPDDLDNGIALCALHHRLFDRGALGVSMDMTIRVSSLLEFPHGDAARLRELQGRELVRARMTVLPAGHHIDWHRRQVFREAV